MKRKAVELLIDKYVIVTCDKWKQHVAAQVVAATPMSGKTNGKLTVKILEGPNEGKTLTRRFNMLDLATASVFDTTIEALTESRKMRK